MEFFDNMSPYSVTYYHDEEYVNNNLVKQRTLIKHYGGPPQQPINNHQLMAPFLPMKFWEFLYDISLWLIVDDKEDLGRFTYFDRDTHYYHFKHSPHHPSPFHHWQIGIVGLFLSQAGALLTKAIEMKNQIKKPVVKQEEYKKPIKVIDLMELPNRDSVIKVTAPKALPAPKNLFDKINHALDSL